MNAAHSTQLPAAWSRAISGAWEAHLSCLARTKASIMHWNATTLGLWMSSNPSGAMASSTGCGEVLGASLCLCWSGP